MIKTLLSLNKNVGIRKIIYNPPDGTVFIVYNGVKLMHNGERIINTET